MSSQGFVSEVPSWDGNPQTYYTFETACRRYAMTLKDSDRKGGGGSCLEQAARTGQVSCETLGAAGLLSRGRLRPASGYPPGLSSADIADSRHIL